MAVSVRAKVTMVRLQSYVMQVYHFVTILLVSVFVSVTSEVGEAKPIAR